MLSVREPRALRDLTFFPQDVRARFIPTLQALFSRTFEPNGAALVKATSFVSEIAGELIAGGTSPLIPVRHAALLISGILAGENSRKELAGRSEQRTGRLVARGVKASAPRSEADLAAAAWACEMTALEVAADGANSLVGRFRPCLGDLDGFLSELAGFFGFRATPERLAEIANGPLMRRYSKATEYEYSPELRRELMAEAERAASQLTSKARLPCSTRRPKQRPCFGKALDRAQAES